MLVKECMSKHPEFIPPDTTLQEAAKLMRERDIGFIPIGENDKLIGVLTDRDIVTRAISKGWDTSKRVVRDIMTNKVLYVFEDQPIEEACESMCLQQVRRLIVLNRKKRLTGILAFHDVAEGSHDEKLCGHVVEEVTEQRRAA